MAINYGIPDYVPEPMQGLYWAAETPDAGTGPLLSSTNWFFEPFSGFDPSPNEDRWPAPLIARLPVASYGNVAMRHHEEFVVHVPWTEKSLAMKALALLAGDKTNTGSAETVSAGPDPFLHTITPGKKSTRVPTLSIIRMVDNGTTASGLLYPYAVPLGITFNLDTSAPVMCDIAFRSKWESDTDEPSAATTVSNADVWMKSTQGTFTLAQGGTSGTDTYTTAIPMSGVINISRTDAEMIHSIGNNTLDPIDILSGVLQFSAQLTMLFDGLAQGKPYGDWMADLQVGWSGNKNIFSWTDDLGHGASITSWPAKWSVPSYAPSGNSAKIDATLGVYQDPNTRSALTLIDTITVTNSSATKLITDA